MRIVKDRDGNTVDAESIFIAAGLPDKSVRLHEHHRPNSTRTCIGVVGTIFSFAEDTKLACNTCESYGVIEEFPQLYPIAKPSKSKKK